MAIRRKRTSIVAPTACSLRSNQGKHLALILDGVDRGFESDTDGALAITEPNTETGMTDYQRVSGRRVQLLQRAPSLRLAAGRLIEFAHDANRRLLDRANLWRTSSALRCCALWHRGYQGRGATRSRVATPRCSATRAKKPASSRDYPSEGASGRLSVRYVCVPSRAVLDDAVWQFSHTSSARGRRLQGRFGPAIQRRKFLSCRRQSECLPRLHWSRHCSSGRALPSH